MKIAYHAEPNPKSDATEQHIFDALVELGHDVFFVSREIPECDFVLFHKEIPDTKYKKVCWYFDKVWGDVRIEYIKNVLKNADVLFMTDETWAIHNPNPKIRILRQGVGKTHKGLKVATNAKIAFTGYLYTKRHQWAGDLYKRYGEAFQVFTGVFNDDLNNLCATVPIFIAPQEPSDDYYWSSRVYITMGSGGFMIHPRCKRLEEEYEDKKEIVFYDSYEDMLDKIDYYLTHEKEREKIRLAGWEKTKRCYTYKHRVKKLFELC